jgi:hypothetical protein
VRPFFWDKIPDAQREKTVWNRLDDSAVDLDIQQLLDTFQAADIKLTTPKDAFSERPKVVDLVNPSKSKSVFIVMKTIKLTGAAIAAELLAMSSRISLDHLASLRPCLPDEADFEVINQYEGPKELLGECERFYLAIKHVALVRLRVDLLLRVSEFDQEMGDAIRQMETQSNAIHQIASSPGLRAALTLILKVGNFLNGGSPRGGAYGFKIDFLTKLRDVRSSEPGFTLLHLIVQLAEETNPLINAMVEELDRVPAASTVDVEHTKEVVGKYRVLMRQCQEQQSNMEMLMLDDGLPKFAQKFVAAAEPLCRRFDGLLEEATTRFDKLRKDYGEDSMRPDEFIGVFAKFLAQYQQVRREVREKTARSKK